MTDPLIPDAPGWWWLASSPHYDPDPASVTVDTDGTLWNDAWECTVAETSRVCWRGRAYTHEDIAAAEARGAAQERERIADDLLNGAPGLDRAAAVAFGPFGMLPAIADWIRAGAP